MDVSREVEAAVAALGRRARRVVSLRAPDPRKRGRSTWRVELEDGSTLKARRLESTGAAKEQFALRAALEPAFVPALTCHGPVLLEEWVEGRPFTAADTAVRAADAGALLGRLHAIPVAGMQATVATDPRRAQARADLETLRAAGALDGDQVAVLGERLAHHDPGTGPAALIHLDFCAENMLVDGKGRLRVFDNEWLTIDAAGLDVGRTLYRWPMSDAVRRGFLDAYRGAAAADPGPLEFWVLVAVIWSARIRLDQSQERREVPLAAARRMAAAKGSILESL